MNKKNLKYFVALILCFTTPMIQAKDTDKIFEWVCQNNKNSFSEDSRDDRCDLLITTINAKSKSILSVDRDFMDHSTLHNRSTDLIEIITGCGSNCTISTFYDFKNDRMSHSRYDVIAVNPKNETFVTVDHTGNVVLCPIFASDSQGLILIHSNKLSSRTAILIDPIEKVTFKNNKIYIHYLDQNDNEKTKIFPEGISHLFFLPLKQSLFKYFVYE